jgi:sirohydrochlorin cobaltochelatase
MLESRLAQAALVLVGHGATANEDSAAAVRQQLEDVANRHCFAEVHACFWKEPPFVTTILSAVRATEVFMVPCFLSEGYFSEIAIPGALGLRPDPATAFSRSQARGRHQVHYTLPVGTHPRMTEVILQRAESVAEPAGAESSPLASETALFLAGHGTTRHPHSRQAAEDHAGRIRALHRYASVEAVFLEEEPRIARIPQLTPRTSIVVVPFFMSDGLHCQEDLPVLLGEPPEAVRAALASGRSTWHNPTSRGGKTLWLAPPAGTAPGVADVILDRVREAALASG